MSRLFLARFAAGLVFFFVSAFAAPTVLTIQSLPQIELSVSRASPGATIEVMGGRFPEDTLVKFVLQNSENQIPLGTAIADDHGEFSTAVLLPLDLQYGEYEFQAIDEKDQMAIAPIAIIADTSSQGGSDQREDSDSLVAPMPTFAPGAISTPLPQKTASETQGSQPSREWVIYPALLGMGLLVLLGFRVLKKR